MCNRSLKQTAIGLSSCEAEFYAASACAEEGTRRTQTHYRGDQADSKIRCLAIQQWIREKRLPVSRVDTKNNTADRFTKHLDGFRTRALAKKLGLRFLDMADDDN